MAGESRVIVEDFIWSTKGLVVIFVSCFIVGLGLGALITWLMGAFPVPPYASPFENTRLLQEVARWQGLS